MIQKSGSYPNGKTKKEENVGILLLGVYQTWGLGEVLMNNKKTKKQKNNRGVYILKTSLCVFESRSRNPS